MKSAITISAVEQARGGPFVLWDTFPNACELAKRIGFDGIEVFAEGPAYFDQATFRSALDANDLELAAVGTGAGWVISRLSLSDPIETKRRAAIDFVKRMIEAVSNWQTRVIIGSMQGRADVATEIPDYRQRLVDSLQVLTQFAHDHHLELLIEPLNRYETNLINNVADGLQLLRQIELPNLRLLCDIFHMNIEEASIGKALLDANEKIGHVHFADSNRWAVGFGHVEYASIIEALRTIKFQGYLSAEVFSRPDAETAARQTWLAFQSLVGKHSKV